MTTRAWDRGTGPSLLRAALARRGQRQTGPAALLWDMDGLLVDSEPVWTVAEEELFARWGAVFTPAIKAAIVGTRLDVAVPIMIAHAGPAAAGEDPAEVSRWLLDRMVELFGQQLPVMPGARALLAEAERARIPQALVSSSFRVLVDAVLASLPGHPFAVSVAGDEVARGKPDPEPYETAAERLGVPIGRCVVLEDTPSGARSGDAAGARVVFCPSVAGTAELAEPGWRPVASLADVSVAGLRAWLAS